MVPVRLSLSLLAILLPLSVHAFEDGVAIVTQAGSGSIQTGTEIRRDMLGECIAKLPTESELAPVNSATDKFVRDIDGTTREGYTTLWSSTIKIGYQLRRRYLYVVTTKGVGQTAAPQFRNDTAQTFVTEQVVSDPSVSAQFYGPNHTRFFGAAADAEASARTLARAKLRELQANLCPDKTR